ncbi:MAG: Kef-type K+ transport system, membrane component [Candidatus Parvarchaeum acidiphilum ARMAN-4]|jgi:Kef-type K+ transport system membrane component KefB|uniref:Kef-type K+ transport system, membrane component n=1 Tax=Candidatus Parvarchaeum acidiphilum ARMAN-4 TaxID=662760 RepID=D2EFU4_PARA4|nr:MAG: Kef-type K+ transport system, membrane component [Candidatus Parvarchaeum acidiphilum ARMAN-4]MCL5975999.1 cation:proton antiporter [Candidatus Parvarchaeota archaeon]
MALNIIIEILIVLASSIIIGELFEQLKFPSVVGYLIAGLIVGPFVFNLIQNNLELQALSSLSLFFIIFLLGIEMKTESVIKYLKPSLKMSITSFILPLILSVTLSVLLLHFGLRQDFIVSLAIAVPSISIVSVLVLRYRLARDPKGITIIGSVVVTDVIAFLLLGITYKSALNAILLVVYFIVFLMIFLNVDKILNRGSEKLRKQLTKSKKILKSEHFGYAMIIIIGLLTGGVSQLIGVNYIIGVFFAGLIIHEGLIGRTLFRKVSKTIKRMNDGFFIPIFFGIAGIDVSSFHSLYIYMPAIIIISVSVIVFSVLLNFFYSKKIMNVKKKPWRIKISAIINGRGAVGIAIATVAFEIGVITNSAYSIAVLATIIISIIATSLLRNA